MSCNAVAQLRRQRRSLLYRLALLHNLPTNVDFVPTYLIRYARLGELNKPAAVLFVYSVVLADETVVNNRSFVDSIAFRELRFAPEAMTTHYAFMRPVADEQSGRWMPVHCVSLQQHHSGLTVSPTITPRFRLMVMHPSWHD